MSFTPLSAANVVAMGDSITYGSGAFPLDGYRLGLHTAFTAAYPGCALTWIGPHTGGTAPTNNYQAQPGWDTSDQLALLSGFEVGGAYQNADVFILLIGTNDCSNQPEADAFAAKFRTLIGTLHTQRAGRRFVICENLLPMTNATYLPRVPTINASLMAELDYAQLIGMDIVRINDSDINTATDLDDTLHPNTAGYAKMAARRLPALATALGQIRGEDMGTLSADLRNRLLDHTFNVATYSAPANIEFAAFIAGTEVSGGSYARKALANNTTNWSNAASRAKTNAAAVTFATASADWGTVDEIRAYNVTTAAEMFRHTLITPVLIESGDSLNLPVGSVDITAPAGSMADAYVHKCLDLAFGATAYTAEATTQFAYFNGNPQSGGTEITGTGYARDINTSNGTTWVAAAGGAIRSGIDFVLGPAGGAWTTATYCALYNNAGTGLMMSAALPVARSVLNGETETIQAGRIRPTFT